MPATEAEINQWLQDLADPDYRVRTRTAQSLGNSRNPRAIDPLIAALSDRTIPVRRAAAVGLGRLKDPRAIPHLLGAMRAPRSEVHVEAGNALAKFKGAVVEPMREIALDRGISPALRVQALRALQKIGTPRCVDTLLDAYGSVAAERDQEYSFMRFYLLEAIARIPGPRPLPDLLAALDTGEPHVRYHVMHLLQTRGDQDAIPALVDYLRQGDLQAFEPLRLLGYEGLADELAAQIDAGGPAMRMLLVFCLAVLGDERARPHVEAYLHHTDASVRRVAAEAMQYLDWVRNPSGRVQPSAIFLRHLVGQKISFSF